MRLKTLNGAPLCEHLDFNQETLLDPQEREPAFRNFLAGKTSSPVDEDVGTSMVIKWRRLEARNTRLQSGWSQPYLPRDSTTDSKSGLSYTTVPRGQASSPITQGLLDDTTDTFEDYPSTVGGFLQHSLIFHDTLMSSQIATDAPQSRLDGADGADNSISSSSFMSTSFDTVTTEDSETAGALSQGPILQLPPNLLITSLGSLPNAAHVRSVFPSTLDRNLLCVLTAEAELREVIVKTTGKVVNLFEITVADETSTGFKISLWYRPGRAQDRTQETIRGTLDNIQVGDILFLRKIVLNDYRDTVYGLFHSKAKSTVEVVMKADGSFGYKHILPVDAEEKFRRIKCWANIYVAPELGGSRKRKGDVAGGGSAQKKSLTGTDRDNDTLPPDTMEAC